jgi:hypothetical protein
MIRETITPQNNQITINIPKHYIDKKLEFIVFPVATKKTLNYKPNSKTTITNSLLGVLKNINIKDYKNYLDNKYL